jgi:hypothetical protein
MQVRSPWHTLPQPLQFAESVRGSTQLPPQTIFGFAQSSWHVPSTHCSPLAQAKTFPHPPQLLSSVSVLRQTPWPPSTQHVSPCGQPRVLLVQQSALSMHSSRHGLNPSWQAHSPPLQVE